MDYNHPVTDPSGRTHPYEDEGHDYCDVCADRRHRRACTLLDPPESSVHDRDRDPDASCEGFSDALLERIARDQREARLELTAPLPLAEPFQHRGWAPVRRRIYAALQKAGVTPGRLDRFALCGSTFVVLRGKANPDLARIACRGCRDRFCLICGQARSRTIAANTLAFATGQVCRFFTLTMRADESPLSDKLNRLYAAWQKLKRTQLWKKTQLGGVAFLEVKSGKKSGLWHPHLHVIATGRFVDHRKLSLTWKALTGDSHIVDVRLARDVKNVAGYVAKYASKPLDKTVTNSEDRLLEAITALHGRKTVEAWGTWRKLRTTMEPTDDTWEYFGTLQETIQLAQTNDPTARKLLAVAAPRLLDYLDFHDLPPPPPRRPIPPLPCSQLRWPEWTAGPHW